MRILFVSNYYPPFELGGWEQLAYDVHQQLVRRGHTVHVITSRYRARELEEFETGVSRILYLDSPDHEHYHWEYVISKPWRERRNKQSIKQLVDQFDPDVIFINGMWNLHHSVAEYLEALSPEKIIYYIASTWPVERDATSQFFEAPMRNRSRFRLKRMIWVILKKTLLLNESHRNHLAFRNVLCVSDFIRQIMIHRVGVPKSQIKVIHNGVNPSNFRSVRREKNSQPLRLIYAGRLTPDKGVHTAIAGVGHFFSLHPTYDFLLTILGNGTKEYEQELKNLVLEYKLENRVSFLSSVQREMMPAVLAEQDILLFPAESPDALPRIVQEAMVSGLVVIGTETGGTPEILHDNRNGLTYEAGNAKHLANQIALIAHDAQLRKEFSHRARQTVIEGFTIERMVNALETEFANYSKTRN